MRNDKKNLIVELTFEFAVESIPYTELLESKKKFVMATQLQKASFSIGANVNEAQNAESKADFIHKMKIAAKETDEVRYFHRICKAAPSYPDPPDSLIDKIQSVHNVLSKIISSSKD